MLFPNFSGHPQYVGFSTPPLDSGPMTASVKSPWWRPHRGTLEARSEKVEWLPPGLLASFLHLF